MKNTISPVLLHEARCAHMSAQGKTEKGDVVRKYAEIAQVSPRAMYRALKLGEDGLTAHSTRSHSEDEAARVALVNEMAQRIVDFAEHHRRGEYKISRSKAIEYFRKNGMIPEGITDSQLRRGFERINAYAKARVLHRRFEKDAPLILVQMDFTRSRRFEVATEKDGSHRIFVRNPNYTRKDEPVRLWIGVAVDDHSRVAFARYYIMNGEGHNEWRQLVLDTFGQKEQVDGDGVICGHRKLLAGNPELLYTDGIGAATEESLRSGLVFLDVKHIGGGRQKTVSGKFTGDANKAARGKVERYIQDIKADFEADLLLELGEGTEITFNDLNDRLLYWLERKNESEHPVRKGVTRWYLFAAALETAQFPPDHAASFFVKVLTKRVVNGLVQVKSDTWCKAPEWARDGAEIEVVRIGESWYTKHKGARFRLDVFTSHDSKITEANREIRREEYLEDKLSEWRQIRPRLVEAMKEASYGALTLAELPEAFDAELEEFCSEPRTVREVIEQAKKFVRAINGQDEPSAKSATIIDTTGRLVEV